MKKDIIYVSLTSQGKELSYKGYERQQIDLRPIGVAKEDGSLVLGFENSNKIRFPLYTENETTIVDGLELYMNNTKMEHGQNVEIHVELKPEDNSSPIPQFSVGSVVIELD